MDTYLTLIEASRIAQVEVKLLQELVRNGKIRSVMLSSGAILVNHDDVLARMPISQRPEYAQFSHLEGKPISLSDASRNYGIPHQTISRWVSHGYINKLGQDGRRVLIDEAELATCIAIYKSSEGSQGRWVFKSGSIYTPRKKVTTLK